MIPSVYINLEDDVAKVTARIKKEKAETLVLVCPKRCQLFSDSINLRLFKKQAELLKKEVFILTMDERGQTFAQEAGFKLKFLPKSRPASAMSDIYLQPKVTEPEEEKSGLVKTVKDVAGFVSGLVGKKSDEEPQPPKEEEPLRAKSETVFADLSFGTELARPLKKKNVYKGPEVHSGKKLKAVKDENTFFDQEVPLVTAKKRKRSSLAITLILALSLIVVLGLVFVVLPSAKVIAYPKAEPVTRDFDIALDILTKAPDSVRLVLPATSIIENVEVSSKFKSHGKKDVGNKATGSVRIYNFTGQILNLKAETTALAAGNKTYYLTEDALQIKPTKYKNELTKEIDESSLSGQFSVIAASGGEDYNLPAGVRLEITNQVFGSRPQVVYAKSQTPISGGTSRFLSVMEDADLVRAQSELGAQALENLQRTLTAENRGVIIENSYRIEVVEFIANQKTGDETPNFEASLKAKITALAFSQDDLNKLLIDRISQTISGNQRLKTNSDFKVQPKIRTIDLNVPSGILSVHFEGKAVSQFNSETLPTQLIGKNRQEASEILQSMAEIEKVELTLSPSWQNTFPWFPGKIKIEIVE